MRTVICDIETNALKGYDKLWTVVCKDVETKERVTFTRPDFDPVPLRDYLRGVSNVIGHHFIGFDYDALKHFGFDIEPGRIVDTLVLSRLLKYNLAGGHSLDAWGERFGIKKPEITNFAEVDQEKINHRCQEDVEINFKLYELFKKYINDPEWKDAIDLEMKTAWICKDLHETGFYFKIDEAKELHQALSSKLATLDEELLTAFPPKARFIKEITPKETKHGTLSLVDFKWLGPNADLSSFGAGWPFSRFEYEPFNPGSPKQIVERLNEAGWKPVVKTKGHIAAERARDKEKLEHFKVWGWQICEENLETLPPDAPAGARKLAERLMLASRLSSLVEYINSYKEDTGRVHPTFMPIGAWTHRKSHQAPNCANIAAVDKPYGKEIRGLWAATPGRILVGTDADGIQLRILAHYLEDQEFTHGLEAGDKADRTDAHSVNQRALNGSGKVICKTRDNAKTFIYAWLLGAASRKVATILECSIAEAQEANKAFLLRYPKLRFLKEKQIPLDAARGYMIGLDGRKVAWDQEHGMLAGYLQNGESIIMKRANILWRDTLRKEGIPFWQVNDVHDEWQTETIDDPDIVKEVQRVQCWSLEQVGVDLGLKCKLAGTTTSGYNWAETH